MEASVLNLLKHEIISRWGAVLGWGIGLALFGSMYISIFPEAEEQMTGLADLSIYQAMGIDLASFEGFIGSTVVLFIPILLGIYIIITSTHALAGEEDDGTLELVLAMPLPRWQVVTVKAIAIGFASLLILAIAGVGNGLVLNAIKSTVVVDVTFQQLFVAVMNGWPISMVFMMMGLFFGAYLPNRRTAALTLTVIFIASYFSENLAGYVASLDAIEPYSLFAYFDSSVDIFQQGVQAEDVLVLFGVAAVFFVLALLSFSRRNVTVGAWPWQRSRVA